MYTSDKASFQTASFPSELTATFSITHTQSDTLPRSARFGAASKGVYDVATCACVCVAQRVRERNRENGGRGPQLAWSQGPLVINNKESQPGRMRETQVMADRHRRSMTLTVRAAIFLSRIPAVDVCLTGCVSQSLQRLLKVNSQGRGCSHLLLQSVRDTVTQERESTHLTATECDISIVCG